MRFPLVRGLYALLILITSCGGGGTFVDPPPPPPPGPTILQLTPATEDAAAAQALGWGNVILNADVTLTPADSSAPAQSFRSSGSGMVDFGLLAANIYIVEVRRWLTLQEQTSIPGGDVIGWVMKTKLSSGGSTIVVPVAASRRHGLVISEWYFNYAALPPVNESYYYGGFLELYNNADTTVHLDGLTIVEGLVSNFDRSSDNCAYLSPYANDPGGIWTRDIQQFPGSGRDYPLLPGKAVVIAVDAIDHSKIVQGGLDLSRADFEFWGGAGDVDNPAVPNMVDTLSVGGDLTGHGPIFDYLGSVVALARPYALATAPRVRLGGDKEWARVNGDLIMEVVSTWSGFVGTSPRCPQLVNARFDGASFDRASSDHNENLEFLRSVSRRATPAGPSGQVILQWTRNSAVDFLKTPRSPGAAP